MTAAAAWGIPPHSPPDAVSASASPAVFSAERALRHVRRLAREPRFIGSAGGTAARDYLLTELCLLGVRPVVQRGLVTFHQDRTLVVAEPHNVVARLEGAVDGPTVLLAAHYDTVPTSPGAADNAAAVAALLETARALRAGPPLGGDVVLLFSDGEEVGLLGARIFAHSPAATGVDAVLNFDARGTEGPSMLFDVAAGSEGLADELPSAVRPVAADSLLDALSELASATTDLHVFEAAGMRGLGFGFAGGAVRYHTRLDTVAALDPRSVQHHGAYAVGLTRRLTSARRRARRDGERVRLTFFGQHVGYSRGFAVVLALLGAVGYVVVSARAWRSVSLRARGVLLGLVASAATVGGAALLAIIAWSVVLAVEPGYRAFPLGHPHNAGVNLAALACMTLAVACVVQGCARRWATVSELALGALVLWPAGALIASATAPGVSHLLTWPLILGVVGIATALAVRGRPVVVAAVLGATGGASLVVAGAGLHALYLAVGLLAPAALAAAGALALAPLAAQLEVVAMPARRMLAVSCSLAAAGLFAVGAATAGPSLERPRPDSLFYALDTRNGRAIWGSYDHAVDGWTMRFLGRSPRRGRIAAYFPLGSRDFLYAPAPVVRARGAAVRLSGSRRRGALVRHELQVRVPAGTRLLTLDITPHTAVRRVAVPAGIATPPVEHRARNHGDQRRLAHSRLAWWTPPPRGLKVLIAAVAGQPLRVAATVAVPGLPPLQGRPAPARPPWVLAQTVYIDGTIVVTTEAAFSH